MSSCTCRNALPSRWRLVFVLAGVMVMLHNGFQGIGIMALTGNGAPVAQKQHAREKKQGLE